MKKFLALVLSVLLICVGCSGCSGSAPDDSPAGNNSTENSSQEEKTGAPLRLCVDFSAGRMIDLSQQRGYSDEKMLEEFLKTVEKKGGPTDIEVEFLPQENGAERQSELNRIRVELMSGAGPDVFLTSCIRPDTDVGRQALFQYPEQAMRRGIFLQLDDYIENAQFMEWDKLTPAVMDAGKTEDGQFLLPLAYSFPLSIFLSDDVQPYPASTTWAQAAGGSDPVLSTSMEPILAGLTPYWNGSDLLSYTWKELVDYDSETLLISEEELLQRAEEALFLEENGGEVAFPHFREVMERDTLNPELPSDPDRDALQQGITYKDSVTMIPLYCDQGGAVVPVRAFAGINVYTERSEDAFFLLDVLLSKDVQKDSSLYELWRYFAMPVNEEVTFGKPAKTVSAYQEARSQITAARFPTPLDSLINTAMFEYRSAKEENPAEADLKEMISRAYGNMKTALDES